MTEPVPAGAVAPPVRAEPVLARSMVLVTVLTALSRATGFARILVIASVLGYGLLGNVYQTANAIPNVIFELIVAGVVQAVLIPSLVVRLDHRDRAGAEHVAGAVLGLSSLVLACAAITGAVLAPLLARVLFAGSPDPSSRADQIRLGTILLWCFLPQVVCYGAGLVASSILNAQHRFAAATAAPIGNNVVVIAACALFWWMRDGAPPSLDLTGPEILVLGLGTTLGVVAFTALPIFAARRTGFAFAPNLDHRDPEVRLLVRRGAWSGLFLASTQLLLATVLVLGNRVQGGVVAYQVGFQFFLLPYALFALPVLMTLFPRMSRHHAAGDEVAFGVALGSGVGTVAYLVAPAAALLGGLSPLIARVFVFGPATGSGASLLADALVGFAPGLVGYSIYLFASRVSYSRGNTRMPALVNIGVVALGAAAMAVGAAVAPTADIVLVLALAHSAAYLGGAAVLLWRVDVALPRSARPRLLAAIGVPLAAGGLLAIVVAAIGASVGDVSRLATVAAIGAITLVAVGGYAGTVAIAGGPRPSTFVAALRGRAR